MVIIQYHCAYVCIYIVKNNSFQLQALCDLVVEAVFPTCALLLLKDSDVCDNEAALSALASGEAYQKIGGYWQILAGSRAEGLTMELRWGHPWSDGDLMILLGRQLGVNIPKNQLPRKCQSPQSSSPTSTLQGCNCHGCLEYAPKGCPLAYTKLRVTDTQVLMEWHPHIDLSDCVEERGCICTNRWLKTAQLNEALQRYIYLNVFDEPDIQTTSEISGPAGQVLLVCNPGNEYILLL